MANEAVAIRHFFCGCNPGHDYCTSKRFDSHKQSKRHKDWEKISERDDLTRKCGFQTNQISRLHSQVNFLHEQYKSFHQKFSFEQPKRFIISELI